MQLEQAVMARLIHLIEMASKADTSIISKSLCGRFSSDGSKGLEACVLGVRYKVNVANDTLNVRVEDPLYRKEDASKLLVYMLNAFERAFGGKIASRRGALISVTQLPGGQTAKLYEKRIVSFLTAEIDAATLSEVKVAVENIGGTFVEHSNASWSFEVAPFNGVRINAAYWQGEENMPSGATLLVGEEIKQIGMPIDELITIMEIAINRFVSFYRKEAGKKPRLFHSLYL